MIRMIALAALATAAMTASSFAAEPIVGTWKRPNGTVIKYAGSGPFCGTVQTGEYKGKSIGCMNGSNGKYTGSVNKLDEGKTYNGKATANATTLKLSGCVAGGLICKSETLKRM
jgi:uncharacterized protein (DUF2147 family)